MSQETVYLSRARLRAGRGEALGSIAPLLLPDDPEKAVAYGHRIVWMLFQDTPLPAEPTDWRTAPDGAGYLWRNEGAGRFMILSRRPPSDRHNLFDLETKAFTPGLTPGDRLRFTLRANPTKAIPTARGSDGKHVGRGKRVDVVMAALHSVPPTNYKDRTGRAFVRDRLVRDTVAAWLSRQGEGAGFTVVRRADDVDDEFDVGIDERKADRPIVRATNYTRVQVERSGAKGKRPAAISVVDIAGEIEITDPTAFRAKWLAGFGSAKAFGCGLMLIRRC